MGRELHDSISKAYNCILHVCKELSFQTEGTDSTISSRGQEKPREVGEKEGKIVYDVSICLEEHLQKRSPCSI